MDEEMRDLSEAIQRLAENVEELAAERDVTNKHLAKIEEHLVNIHILLLQQVNKRQ